MTTLAPLAYEAARTVLVRARDVLAEAGDQVDIASMPASYPLMSGTPPVHGGDPMIPIRVPVKQLPHAAGLPLPQYATAGAAGLDLTAAIDRDFVLYAGDRGLIPTGISVAVPAGYELQIRPRSGLALRHTVTVLNAPGTIDADYRGEISVLLINHGRNAFTIERGMRIAQGILAPVYRIEWSSVDELPETKRGGGGFGSTGV